VGTFKTHIVGDKLYFEIPNKEMNRDMLLVGRFERSAVSPGDFNGYGGDQFTERTLRWERSGNRVILRSVSFGITADSTLPVARAVMQSNNPTVVAIFPVEAYGPDSAAVMPAIAAALLAKQLADGKTPLAERDGALVGFHVSAAGGIVFALGLGALGYQIPGLFVSSRITQRREQVRAALPDALDLLAVSVEAGLVVDGAISSNTPIKVAVAMGARRLIVLPTGYACATKAPPLGAVANALHALTLLIARQLVSELEDLASDIEYFVVPPLCPLVGSPYDFSRTADHIERAIQSTDAWLAQNGLEKSGIPHEMRPHSH